MLNAVEFLFEYIFDASLPRFGQQQQQFANMNQAQRSQKLFQKIEYKGVKQINYLSDLTSQSPMISESLQKLASAPSLPARREHSKFDNIANQLYKKIVKQGYVQRPSTVSKKGKKGDADLNFYNTNDQFIDDQQILEKKDHFSQFNDYKCIPMTSIEQLYESQQYKSKADEIVSQSLKRKTPDQFNPHNQQEIEKLDEVKKKIKNDIKMYLDRIKQNDEQNPIVINPNVQVIQVIDVEDNLQPPAPQENQ